MKKNKVEKKNKIGELGRITADLNMELHRDVPCSTANYMGLGESGKRSLGAMAGSCLHFAF